MSEYRLDELAKVSGTSARNIRAYRDRGLLEAPRREGRAAFYDDRHVAQLRLIDELLRKGFTSAHIAEFFEGTRQGRDLTAILGLRHAVFGPPRVAAPVPAGVDADDLVRYGLARVVDGDLTLVNPGIAEIVGGALEQTAYLETILRVCDGSAELLDELATAVAAALRQSLSAHFGEDREAVAGDGELSRRVAADYRALGRRVVADQLEDALQRHLADESA